MIYFCDCGRVAVKKVCGDHVCQRCLDFEQRMYADKQVGGRLNLASASRYGTSEQKDTIRVNATLHHNQAPTTRNDLAGLTEYSVWLPS